MINQLDSLPTDIADYGLSGKAVKIGLMVIPCYQGSKNPNALEPIDRERTEAMFERLRPGIKTLETNWIGFWHLHPNLQTPVEYQDGSFERYSCIIFVASIQ